MSAFTGFPEGCFRFYDQLAGHNTRAWFAEHKGEYEHLVRVPMQLLSDELAGEFGASKLFRPYKDARYSRGEPIKDHQGAVVAVEDAMGYYVQVSAAGLMVAGGWYAPAGRQLERYRGAVDGPAGAELERLVQAAGRRFHVDTNPLATRPRGVPADHPRLGLLRARKLVVERRYPIEPWMSTSTAVTRVRDDWRSMRSLIDWLADHVGPHGDPADAP